MTRCVRAGSQQQIDMAQQIAMLRHVMLHTKKILHQNFPMQDFPQA